MPGKKKFDVWFDKIKYFFLNLKQLKFWGLNLKLKQMCNPMFARLGIEMDM
jgi:hypothetical protein